VVTAGVGVLTAGLASSMEAESAFMLVTFVILEIAFRGSGQKYAAVTHVVTRAICCKHPPAKKVPIGSGGAFRR
jgi:hypothetical protein